MSSFLIPTAGRGAERPGASHNPAPDETRRRTRGALVVDRTYGHLVLGSEARAREKLDARASRKMDTASIETTGII